MCRTFLQNHPRDQLLRAFPLMSHLELGQFRDQAGLEIPSKDAGGLQDLARVGAEPIQPASDELSKRAGQRKLFVDRLLDAGIADIGRLPVSGFVAVEETFSERGPEVLRHKEWISLGVSRQEAHENGRRRTN